MGLELWLEYLAEPEHHVCFLTGIVTCSFNRTFLEWDLGASLAAKIRIRRHCVLEEFETEHIEPV